MIIDSVIKNLHNNNLTPYQIKETLDELQKNTLLRYLGEFGFLPNDFKKQLDDYLKNQKQFDHNETTNVHDHMFLDKRNVITTQLEKMFETNVRTVADIIDEIKTFTNNEDMVEYLSFIIKQLKGGDTENQIKLSLQYYLEKAKTPQDVLMPLKDAMMALEVGEIYKGKTYSCMPGLACRLLDRVAGMMDSQDVDRDDTDYRDYAQSVLHNHVSGEGKMSLMSALWYALDLPELKWTTDSITKKLLHFNDQPISNLNDTEVKSAQEVLFQYFESDFINTDEWVKKNRSDLNKFTKEQISDDNERMNDIRDLNDDYNKYIENYVNTFLERHQEPVNEKLRAFEEGSAFSYKDIHVDVTILKAGKVDDVLLEACQKFEEKDKESLLSEMCKRLKLDIGQLRCILLGIVDGLDGLFREMYATQSSEKADKVMSEAELENKVEAYYKEREVKSLKVYRCWQENSYESRLYLPEMNFKKNNIITKLYFISEDMVLSYMQNNEISDSIHSLIFNAVTYGYRELSKQLLKLERVDVNMYFKLDRNFHFRYFPARTTLLVHASYMGHRDIVSMLLERDEININKANTAGHTALMLAAVQGHEEIVRILLAREGVEVNKKSSWYGSTALMYAAGHGHDEIVSMLLARDEINVNKANTYGYTALMLAAANGHKEIVSMLLARDEVEVNAKSSLFLDYGQTALMYAAGQGHKEIVSMLLERADIEVNAKSSLFLDYGLTALMCAAKRGHKEIVSMLLERADIEVNAKSSLILDDGQTALMYAAERGHKEIVSMLLERADIEVNAKSSLILDDGQTALMYAAERGHKEIVSMLCDHKDIDINKRSIMGKTALMCAAKRGHKEIVSMLLKRADIEVNNRNIYRFTAIRSAVFAGQSDIVETLLNDPRTECHILDIGCALVTCNLTIFTKLYRHHWISQKIDDTVLYLKPYIDYCKVSISLFNDWLVKKVSPVHYWFYDSAELTAASKQPNTVDYDAAAGVELTGNDQGNCNKLNDEESHRVMCKKV